MMRLFALLPLPFQIGIVLALVAAVVGGYEAWHHSVYKEGAAAQKVLDDKVIADANRRIGALQEQLSNSQGDLAQCKLASETQSKGVLALDARAKLAQEAVRKALAQAAIDRAAHATEVQRLQAMAAAKPKVDQSCAETLKSADTILRDSARERRK